MDFPRKIYAIQHNVTRRIYIGSTTGIEGRYYAHLQKLRTGKHPIEDMQKDFDEYGENYSIFILDEINEYEDRKKEYEYMRKYNTFTRGVGYNYKDKEKEIRYYRNLTPIKNGSPQPFLNGDTQKVKEEYIDKISTLIYRTNDITLLDLIHKMLQKSK